MRRFALLLSLTMFLASCREPSQAGDAAPSGAGAGDAGGIATRIEVVGEARVGAAPLQVFLLEEGEGIGEAAVDVTGTMTHAGMEPVVRTASEVEPGLYRADDFEFTMAGDWILLADATLPDGRTARAETAVTVRQP